MHISTIYLVHINQETHFSTYRVFEKVTDKLKPWVGGTTPSKKKIGTLGLRSTDFKLRPFNCNQ